MIAIFICREAQENRLLRRQIEFYRQKTYNFILFKVYSVITVFLDTRTPAQTFPEFPSIIQSDASSKRQHVMEKHVLIGYQTSYVCSSNLKVCSNVDVKLCFARVVTEVFWR